MAVYYCEDETALDSTADTALNVTSNSGTAHRGRILEVHCTFETPSDFTSPLIVALTTTTGTGSAPTIEPADPNDRAAQATATGNCSSEPTTGDRLLRLNLYHRIALIYKIPETRPWIWPATANNGIGASCSHASTTTNYLIGMVWEE